MSGSSRGGYRRHGASEAKRAGRGDGQRSADGPVHANPPGRFRSRTLTMAGPAAGRVNGTRMSRGPLVNNRSAERLERVNRRETAAVLIRGSDPPEPPDGPRPRSFVTGPWPC